MINKPLTDNDYKRVVKQVEAKEVKAEVKGGK